MVLCNVQERDLLNVRRVLGLLDLAVQAPHASKMVNLCTAVTKTKWPKQMPKRHAVES